MNFNIKSNKGFTLVELLVVVGILAVLAAIAIPSIAGLIDRANVSADKTNSNEMTNAIERFTSEYELYCQDIASGAIKDEDSNGVPDDMDAAQGRVFNVTGAITSSDIETLEVAQGATITDDMVAIYRDTKYPANIKTVRKVIRNYTKTSSSTFEPKQSDMHYWYSPDVGVIVVAQPNETKENLNKLVLSGRDATGKTLDDNTIWLDITAYNAIAFGVSYKSDFIETDNGFLTVLYSFNQDGSAYSCFTTYAPDKTTVIDTMNTSYSVGSFSYENGCIRYDSIKFATIESDGETLLQLGTSYGDVPLNRE